MRTGQIPTDFVKNLSESVDLPQFLQSFIQVKKNGAHFKACCPFHHEKTPSFVVYNNHYHCFGCGVHGDAIGFLMAHQGLDFVVAVERVAKAMGISVPRDAGDSERYKEITKQISTLEAVSVYYQNLLWDEEKGREGRTYLRERGLTSKVVKHFALGCSASGWSHLSHYFEGKDAELTAAGLVLEGKKGLYDRFRHRLMFPIRNYKGECVGFGGRVLTDDKPKYLNSPETDTFKKGELLYGLFEYLSLSQRPTQLFVVEGYMDVIGLYQHGVTGALATLGTAFSEVHWHTIKKYRQPVVFCFDGDEAGLRAAWRSLQVVLPLIQAEDEIRFLFLPKGEDPDSIVKKEGKEQFLARAKGALRASELILNDVQQGLTPEQRARKLRQKAALINKLRDASLKGMWVEATAQAFSCSAGLVWRALKETGNLQIENVLPGEVKTAAVKKPQNQVILKMLRVIESKPLLVKMGKIKTEGEAPALVMEAMNAVNHDLAFDFYVHARELMEESSHFSWNAGAWLNDEEAVNEWEALILRWKHLIQEEKLNQLKEKAKNHQLTLEEKKELAYLLGVMFHQVE